MSGKSTLLRTVGVNVILAQTVNTCLARDYVGPVLDVRSCIGRSDDLIAGKSYYLVEVEALLGLVRLSESTASAFVSARRTLPRHECRRTSRGGSRCSPGTCRTPIGSESRTSSLRRRTTAELVNLARECYDAYHFGDSIGPDGLVFDHRLKAGPGDDTHGDRPAETVRCAGKVAESRDQDGRDARSHLNLEPRRQNDAPLEPLEPLERLEPVCADSLFSRWSLRPGCPSPAATFRPETASFDIDFASGKAQDTWSRTYKVPAIGPVRADQRQRQNHRRADRRR